MTHHQVDRESCDNMSHSYPLRVPINLKPTGFIYAPCKESVRYFYKRLRAFNTLKGTSKILDYFSQRLPCLCSESILSVFLQDYFHDLCCRLPTPGTNTILKPL